MFIKQFNIFIFANVVSWHSQSDIHSSHELQNVEIWQIFSSAQNRDSWLGLSSASSQNIWNFSFYDDLSALPAARCTRLYSILYINCKCATNGISENVVNIYIYSGHRPLFVNLRIFAAGAVTGGHEHNKCERESCKNWETQIGTAATVQPGHLTGLLMSHSLQNRSDISLLTLQSQSQFNRLRL